MKAKHRALILCLATVLMIGVCGCEMGDNNNPKGGNSENAGGNDMLNERQMKILSEQGLSTDYKTLDEHQQEAIVAIEELLSYLETKYEIGFTYLGYNAKGPLEDEKLTAYPSDGDELIDIVTATRKHATIVDDYINVVILPVFNDVVSTYVRQFFAEKDFKVFSEISSSKIDELPVNAEDLKGNIGAGNWIFIDSSSVSETEFNKFVDQFPDWIKENKFYGTSQLIYFEKDATKYLTIYNYEESLDSEKCLRKVRCMLNNDDTITTW
jgi:hypothetical protein